MVTYVVPIVGLVLGVVFNSEPLTRNLIFGSLLIVSGIGIVNLPKRPITPA
jgi:drug/metabolite transporter (DMT)-like permease